MATNARVGILVPGSFAGTPPTLSEFTAFFQRADDLGLHSLWVIDRIFHTVNILDPMTLLTCAATVISRVRLGTSVLLFALRNPVLMAKTTATLDTSPVAASSWECPSEGATTSSSLWGSPCNNASVGCGKT